MILRLIKLEIAIINLIIEVLQWKKKGKFILKGKIQVTTETKLSMSNLSILPQEKAEDNQKHEKVVLEDQFDTMQNLITQNH